MSSSAVDANALLVGAVVVVELTLVDVSSTGCADDGVGSATFTYYNINTLELESRVRVDERYVLISDRRLPNHEPQSTQRQPKSELD